LRLEIQVRQKHGNRKLLYLVELYKKLNQVETVNLDDVAEWALRERHYRPEPIDPAKMLKRELAQAMKNEYVTDPQNRSVRKYYAVRRSDGEHTWSEWATGSEADPGHMRLALQQHRQYILGNCRQHKLNFDSYNDNNKFGATLPLFDYNFNKDLEEEAFPTEYPSERLNNE